MRPLKLRLANFACFRGEATELDFAGLELFAIAGPTGAGKSSLLDAIIFALYGAVPRMRRGFTEMISSTADRMSVALDFRVGATSYRVTRIARRRGAGNAQLEELGGDDNARPLKDGVREVNDEVARILGLTYDAFTQAVVLPQGEFQKFLKSQAGERREILSRILRLEIYERMRQLASGNRETLGQAVQERERRLSEDYADATPAALEELNCQTNRRRAEIEMLSGQLSETEVRRDAVRTARTKTRELEQRRTRFSLLEADDAQIRAYKSQLEGGRRASPVLPLIRAVRAAEEQATGAKRSYDTIVKDHARLQTQRTEAEHQLKAARKGAEEVPVIEQRVAALDQVIGRIRPRPKLAADLTESQKGRADIESKLANACTEHQKAEHELATAQQNLQNSEEALLTVQFDPMLFDKLDATREEGSRITDLRGAVVARAAEARTAKGQLKDKEVALARADAAVDTAEGEWKYASQRLREVDQQCVEARHREAAAVLRRELRIGEPCPVCEHPVAEHPSPLTTLALDALQQELEEAHEAEAGARDVMDNVRATAAATRAAVAGARQIVDQSIQRCNVAEAELTSTCEVLAERVRGLIIVSADRALEEQVHEAYRRSAANKLQHEAAGRARDEADRAVQRLQQSAARFKAAMTTLADQLTRDDKRIAELTQQIREIDDEVRNVTKAPDPQAERDELTRRRGNLENALRASQAADAKAATDLSGAAVRLEESERVHKKAERDVLAAHAEARTAATAAGFADPAAAAEAELSRSDEQKLSQEVEAHRHEWRAVETRIRELTDELGDNEVGEETLLAAEAALAELREGLRSAESSRAALDERILSLTRAIERASKLREELEKLRAEQSVYHSLALDLRSDRFQAFLLEETFRELVSGASVRLWDLTKRYRFEWQNEAFHVIDHDNARQVRSADTLSGGETFLASLALALQLSEQVQKAAGATILDSLFIDEGFGSLDPEALDAAAGAIESLQTGGRMVGIITHIEELSLRLPARVKVGKTTDGARLLLESG